MEVESDSAIIVLGVQALPLLYASRREHLKCYECRKTSSYEEVEIVERDDKRFWVCPHCDFETEIVERIYSPRKRK